MLKFTTLCCTLIAFALTGASIAHAQSARSAWDESDYSRVRLLMSPQADGAGVDGGVEIQLEPGWHTYWRVPGDAGVPPQFDFSGSLNVADVSVNYPIPERYDDGASISVIYKDRVVFPLAIRATDPAKPVKLSLKLFYGACADVCIPVKASIAAAHRPGDAPDPLARVAIAEFKRRLPEAPQPDFAISSVTRAPDELIISTVVPQAEGIDLFAEGPAEWFTGQPELTARSDGGATFSLSLNGVPEGARIDGAFDFLLVAGRRGVLAKSVPVDRTN